jgi:hypothetical protein
MNLHTTTTCSCADIWRNTHLNRLTCWGKWFFFSIWRNKGTRHIYTSKPFLVLHNCICISLKLTTITVDIWGKQGNQLCFVGLLEERKTLNVIYFWEFGIYSDSPLWEKHAYYIVLRSESQQVGTHVVCCHHLPLAQDNWVYSAQHGNIWLGCYLANGTLGGLSFP